MKFLFIPLAVLLIASSGCMCNVSDGYVYSDCYGNIIPCSNSTSNLGSTTRYWDTIYVENIVGATSGGASSFLDLTDTPNSYVGSAGDFVRVNLAGNALEFVGLAGGGDMLQATYDVDADNIVDKAENVDDGAGNASTAAQVKTAVTNSHVQGSDTTLGTQAENLDMGGFAITNVGNVDGVDVSAIGAASHAQGTDTALGTQAENLDMGGFAITNVGNVDGVDVSDHDSRHAVSGADTIFPADPNADKYLMWDDAPVGVLVWADVGAGDMLKATYDTDADNLVDKAENVDDGAGNASTAAQVKDAVTKAHTQGTDTALGAVGVKNPPIDADKVLYRDSAAADALVTSTWSQVKAFLKTYFDGIYGSGTGNVTTSTLTQNYIPKATTATNIENSSISDNGTWVTVAEHLYVTGNITVTGVVDGVDVSVIGAASHTQGTDTALGAVGTKNPPIDADKVIYRDSTAGDALVTSTWTQVKAFLKTYFDGVYVAGADYIAKALMDADTVLTATNDDTPVATTMAEQTVLGRLTGGHPDDVAIGIADNNIVQIDDAGVVDNEYAKYTANGIEGRSYSEVLSDLSGQAGASFSFNGKDITGIDNLISTADSDTLIDMNPAQDTIYVRPGSSAGDNYVVVYSESDDSANPAIYPSANAEGQIGLTGSRWANGWFTTVTTTNFNLGALGTKNPPIDADKVVYRDSTAADALVTSTWTQVKAFLKTYFDGIYSSGNVTTSGMTSTYIPKATSSTNIANSAMSDNGTWVTVAEHLYVTGNITPTGVVDGVDVSSHASRHAVSGADTVFPADPNADRYLMWDDAPVGEVIWTTVSASPASGTIIAIDLNETETAGGAVEQKKTYSLGANSYQKIIVEMDWEIAGSANTMFEWTVAIEIPDGSVIHDSNVRADATGSGDIFKYAGSYKASAVCTSASTLEVRITPVTAGAATAKVLSMRVYGMY